ncbi:MAG: hypothetical protein RLZZ118_2131, partial [Bacteroidota bacterium]
SIKILVSSIWNQVLSIRIEVLRFPNLKSNREVKKMNLQIVDAD